MKEQGEWKEEKVVLFPYSAMEDKKTKRREYTVLKIKENMHL